MKMANAYTPGPWKIEESNVFPKRITSDTSPAGLETHICEMVTVNDALFADAALIAAAPELLAALKVMLSRFGGATDKTTPAELQAIAAIAKATGA